jgi:hypothetical protein
MAKFTRGKVTAAGNFIFASSTGNYQRTAAYDDLCLEHKSAREKLGFHRDVPLKNIKIRTRISSWSHQYEQLSATTISQLRELGVITIGDLVTRVSEKPVKAILTKNHCSAAIKYLNSIAETFPQTRDPNYVEPVNFPMNDILLENELATSFSTLSKDVRTVLQDTIRELVYENLPILIKDANIQHLKRQEVELASQLAKVRCQLGGGVDC